MELLVAKPNGKASAKVAVSPATFGQDFNEPLIHQVVNAYLTGARSGTKAQKTRAQVRGGGAKPWRQKGTGRARAGTIRSPIWRAGGRAFAADPVDHSQKVNRKMYRGAMRSILSELVRQERLVVVADKDLEQSEPKTKALRLKLNQYGVENALIVLATWDLNLYLSARNIPNVQVQEVSHIDPVSLIRFEKVVMTESAIKKLEEVLA